MKLILSFGWWFEDAFFEKNVNHWSEIFLACREDKYFETYAGISEHYYKRLL